MTASRTAPAAGVALWLVVVLMAVSFAAGFAFRGYAAGTAPAPAPFTGVSPTGTQPAPTQPAPPLNDQQLGGTLPSGHPPVSGGP